MFEFTIQADSWDDLRMKVLALFPEKPLSFKGTPIIADPAPTTDTVTIIPLVPAGFDVMKATPTPLPKKSKGWPKGKKRGKKTPVHISTNGIATANSPVIDEPIPQSIVRDQLQEKFSEITRTYDNPKDAYMSTTAV